MGGGYFSCGRWMGDDKTASAFFDVLDGLEEETITEDERILWETECAAPLRSQLGECDEDELPFLELSRTMLDVLMPPARRYFDVLNDRLGHPDPSTWHAIGESRAGEGWQLMCLHDLFQAYDASCNSDKPVVIHFD